MATIVTSLSWLIVAAGIVLAAGTLVLLRRPVSALHVLLDLFLAAGLLRLSADASWPTIAATAAVVIVRRIVTRQAWHDPRRGGVPARWPSRP